MNCSAFCCTAWWALVSLNDSTFPVDPECIVNQQTSYKAIPGHGGLNSDLSYTGINQGERLELVQTYTDRLSCHTQPIYSLTEGHRFFLFQECLLFYSQVSRIARKAKQEFILIARVFPPAKSQMWVLWTNCRHLLTIIYYILGCHRVRVHH